MPIYIPKVVLVILTVFARILNPHYNKHRQFCTSPSGLALRWIDWDFHDDFDFRSFFIETKFFGPIETIRSGGTIFMLNLALQVAFEHVKYTDFFVYLNHRIFADFWLPFDNVYLIVYLGNRDKVTIEPNWDFIFLLKINECFIYFFVNAYKR